ncbi:MAG TPA: hypothetical protein ENK18_12900 [Deltaproteobacteria bacterium]|nr:hypothetical protein [Deltaproteobacteria bacterium]
MVDLKIDGTVVQERAPPGLYHPFTDMPDGSLVYARHGSLDVDGDGSRDGDAVVRLAPDGATTEVFHCSDWLGETCGANTVSYNPDQGVFLYSLFTHNSILELDATTGELLRWYGQIPGGFAFDGAPFWYQHGGYYTEAGTLLTSTHRDEFDFELVVREYEIDVANERLVEIWSFGEGEGVPGKQMGEAHRLPGGNTLHNYGTHAVLREATPEGRVVWDVRWEAIEYAEYLDGHVIGRSAPIYTDLYAFAPPRP